MIEELLVINNTTKIPLIIVRPSIIGTSAYEPLPGWTDSMGLLQGAVLSVGLGILRDVPGNGQHMADIIPVDYVARHILVSIPYFLQTQPNQSLFITQCTSSSMNPTTWNNFFNHLTRY